MRFQMLKVLGLSLLFLCSSVSADTKEDAAQARSYLKDYLKQLNQKYPFSDWEKQLGKCRTGLDRIRSQTTNSTKGYDRGTYKLLGNLDRDVQEIIVHRAAVIALIRELYASSLTERVNGMFTQNGKHWDADTKQGFLWALQQYEAGSIKPKNDYLAKAAALERDFRPLQTDLLYAFAKDFLGHRVEDRLRTFDLAKIEALYDDFSLQLDYWSKNLQTNSVQTCEQLVLLSKKFDENKSWLRQNLDSLVEVLNTDMLFSDLLEYAGKQKVDFTLEVEEKIETALKEQNQTTLGPIQERIRLWKAFATDLHEMTSQAQEVALHQKAQAMAKAEDERKERERMEALRAEQRRLVEEQKAKFKQTLSELRTFTFKSETSVELDDDSKKALKTKAGFLKTSYVRSGSTKLKVDMEKFSDTLALVQKFKVESGQIDFSTMSLQERSSQSAYTYLSPAGRSSQGDLINFVAEVALGSFSSFYTFLSYVTPDHWNPGRAFAWKAERDPSKAAQDREFSYVDLVVDAHRKRSGSGSTRGEASANLPANMIVIFDPQGAIIRFQSFGDINEVSIQNGDLVGGKVYYKFLNYSADRERIYLNGIDGEMKIGTPTGKS